ncbi:LAFE_0E02718g1_1 [Lachancea fermentati]|uniref:LAFE_0E02718g1_1 n=1 Tax=Lachancea fermentati TaxID=4955 RepID=A0A1G4MCH9_LACFM|nr:LAFE_0E02718g1_1 [Lachancea fermentati]
MHFKTRFFEVSFPESLVRLSNVPSATKYLSIAYVVFTITLFYVRKSCQWQLPADGNSGSNFKLIASPILQLIPAETLRNPWSLVLSNLVDTELWKFLANLTNLVIGGSFIERNWNSSTEILRFVLVIGSLTNLAVVLVTIVSSALFPGVRLDLPLDGNYTIIVGFPVVYKQLMPETTIFKITNVPLLSKNFRFKLLPIFVLVVLTTVQLIWFHHFSQLLSIWITFMSCWVYLRFYQILPSSIAGDHGRDIIGDASDTFQLIYFFPGLLRPILRPFFNICYNIWCNNLRMRKPFELEDIDVGNTLAEQRGAKKVSNNAEERRRQLALQLLGERFQEGP